MSRVIRPDLRSPRRSRRRQAVLVCCGTSYLSLVTAGLLALLSLVANVGPATVVALAVAGALALTAIVLLGVDAYVARRRPVAPIGARLA